LPGLSQTQAAVGEDIRRLLALEGVAATRWERIWKGSGIETRHAVAPLSQSIGVSTAERMRLFDAHAPALADEACRRALADAGVPHDAVTDLIVVTCTGFAAPGVPRHLIGRLGLSSGVRSSQIGFMGCFGGVCGLRAAAAHAIADPQAIVLMVCVELCSLHLRRDRDPQNLVASALFGDGAAAAVVACGHHRPADRTDHRPAEMIDRSTATPMVGDGRTRASSAPVIRPGRSLTVPDTLDAMSWTITDSGFAMTLAREVPDALALSLPALIDAAGDVLVHPGGPAVIEAAAEAMGPARHSGLEHSRAVLRECGNMSSATILFVLERWRRAGGEPPGTLVAFGPGLTIDTVRLE